MMNELESKLEKLTRLTKVFEQADDAYKRSCLSNELLCTLENTTLSARRYFSSFLKPEKLMVFGEVGLGGEVRAASHVRERVKEGARLGFERCIIPKQSFSSLSRSENYGIQIIGVRTLEQAFRAINADKEKENKE